MIELCYYLFIGNYDRKYFVFLKYSVAAGTLAFKLNTFPLTGIHIPKKHLSYINN